MALPILETLLAGNDTHVASLPAEMMRELARGQQPPVVSMCCSDSRVPQQGMFDAQELGYLFTASTIGNQVWDVVGQELVVDGSVLYPIENTGTRTVVVVGHTGCGAVTAALAAHRGELGPASDGIGKWIELLEPVVDAALEAKAVDADADDGELVDQLVEVNVKAQASFLADHPSVPEEVDIYGFVYDLTGAYGGPQGRTYLVWANGVDEPKALRELVGEAHEASVASLLP